MTTPTAPSAYPPALEDLLPQVRALAETLGEMPSRNALMRRLHIGDKKANALLAALDEPTEAPAPRRLHAVPDRSAAPEPGDESPAAPPPVQAPPVADAPPPAPL